MKRPKKRKDIIERIDEYQNFARYNQGSRLLEQSRAEILKLRKEIQSLQTIPPKHKPESEEAQKEVSIQPNHSTDYPSKSIHHPDTGQEEAAEDNGQNQNEKHHGPSELPGDPEGENV